MTMPPSERLPSEQRALDLVLRGDRSLAATPTLFFLCAETVVNVAIPDIGGECVVAQFGPSPLAVRTRGHARQEAGQLTPFQKPLDQRCIQHIAQMMCGDVGIRHRAVRRKAWRTFQASRHAFVAQTVIGEAREFGQCPQCALPRADPPGPTRPPRRAEALLEGRAVPSQGDHAAGRPRRFLPEWRSRYVSVDDVMSALRSARRD